MSWHYSQALEEAYWAASCSGGGQSAPSNGTPTHGTFWSPGKTTDALKPSRSGMTFKPSTESHGEAVLMWCLAASPARTSPQQEKAPGSMGSEAPCGSTWQESSVKFDPATSSWKTHRCLWQEEVPESQVILPKWGMIDALGVLWERTTPELLTSGTGSGSWPTPRAGNPGSRPNGKGGKILAEEVKKSLFPTAKASDGTKGSRTAEGAAREWARGKNKDLGMVAALWPTPSCKGLDGGSNSRNAAKERGMWPTPYGLSGNQGQGDGEFGKAVRNSQEDGGQLNPTWVEWLMGWPLGWTDCAASATDKFRQWCASHGISSDKL